MLQGAPSFIFAEVLDKPLMSKRKNQLVIFFNELTHFFPIHPFSTPGKQGFLMFSGGREMVDREQMC